MKIEKIFIFTMMLIITLFFSLLSATAQIEIIEKDAKGNTIYTEKAPRT